MPWLMVWILDMAYAMVMENTFSIESRLSLPLTVKFSSALTKILNGFLFRSDGTINRRLANLCDWFVTVKPGISNYVVRSEDVVIHVDAGVWIRLYIPSTHSDAQKALPVIFYFHGGGFAVLTPKNGLYDSFCRNLCSMCNVIVVSVHYRLAPEYRCPIAYDDCFLSLTWVRENATSLNADISSCFLMGDSSGANISHHIYCMIMDHADKMRPLQIKGNVLLFPFVGGKERTASEIRIADPLLSVRACDWYWTAFLPIGSDRDHPSCNLLGPQDCRDYTKVPFPPSMVVIAEHDLLKDLQFIYAQRLKAYCNNLKVEYFRGGYHSFHMFGKSKLYSDLMSKIHAFIADCVRLS